MIEPDTGETITFATQLLELLHGASTTTTYKYALLLALIDLCQENVGRRQGSKGSVTTRQLATRVLELYWPQTRHHPESGVVLRQMTRSDRSIPRLIAEHRLRFQDSSSTPHRSRLAHREAFEDLLDEIEWTLIRYPIPLLQRLGLTDLHLLYSINWREQPPRGPVRRYQRYLRQDRPHAGGFDNIIVLLPQVERRLTTLSSLLRPLIRREWARFVARCNGDELEDLEVFLFEPQREDLSACRGALVELQSTACFYCGNGLGSRVDIDHFLPWSRCADDGLHNLVAAHPGCNGDKSDHLAAERHLAAWRARLDVHGPALGRVADRARLPFHPERSMQLARALYSVVPPQLPLWLRADEFELAEPARLLAALGA